MDTSFTAYLRELATKAYGWESMRKGQYAFNLLSKYRPELARKVQETQELDPFNDSKKLPEFFSYVEKNWNRFDGKDK